MSSADDEPSALRAGRSVRELLEETIISGLAVIVPVVVTVFVLNAVFGYVFSALRSLLSLLEWFGLQPQVATVFVYVAAVAGLVALVIVVGFVTRFRYGELFLNYFDLAFSTIPGIGSIYEGFREMSEVMLESDTRSFRDVKAVEFPHEGAYTLGFVTTETPEEIRSAVDGDRMLTLFLPLAPNPVMGGHLAHIPEDRVYDVDMTVEEGIRTVVTSGVAVSEPVDDDGATERQIADLADVRHPQGFADGADRAEHAGPDIPGEDRREEYREDIDEAAFRGDPGGDDEETDER